MALMATCVSNTLGHPLSVPHMATMKDANPLISQPIRDFTSPAMDACVMKMATTALRVGSMMS